MTNLIFDDFFSFIESSNCDVNKCFDIFSKMNFCQNYKA